MKSVFFYSVFAAFFGFSVPACDKSQALPTNLSVSASDVDLTPGTDTPTPEFIPTETSTDTVTDTPTETDTPTPADTDTPTATPTFTTCTNVQGDTCTPTKTFTGTRTWTRTRTDTPTPEPTATETDTWTPAPGTDTPTPAPTSTSTSTRTKTNTPEPVCTGIFGRTCTFTRTPTKTRTPTRTRTSTRTPTPTKTRTNTRTATPQFSYTFTATPTLTSTDTPTVALSATPTETPIPSPTIIGTPEEFFMDRDDAGSLNARQLELPTPEEAVALTIVPSDCVDLGLTMDEWLTEPLNISAMPAGDWTFRVWTTDILVTESAAVSISVYEVDEFNVVRPLFTTSHAVSFGLTPTLHTWTESRPAYWFPEYGTHRIYAVFTATGSLLCTGLNVRIATDAVTRDSSIIMPVVGAPTAVPGS